MLDAFEIVTTSGVVLWSRSYATIGANIINSLIREVFIEQNGLGAAAAGLDDSHASSKPAFKKDQYTLKWTAVKELGLIFVAVYQSLIHLSWIDKFLENIKTLFVRLYADQLGNGKGESNRAAATSRVRCPFDPYFDQQLNELSGGGDSAGAKHDTVRYAPRVTITEAPLPPRLQNGGGSTGPASSVQGTATSQANKNGEGSPVTTAKVKLASAANHLLSASTGKPGQRASRRARKAANQSAHASSGEESGSNSRTKNSKGVAGKAAAAAAASKKKLRRWDADGMVDESDDNIQLDYSRSSAGGDSAASPGENGLTETPRPGESEDADTSSSPPRDWGTRSGGAGRGTYVLPKDLDDEVHSILAAKASEQKASGAAKGASASSSSRVIGAGLGTLSSLFRNVVGGKTLTKRDLEKPMKAMEEHLMKKNVAHEAAVALCEGVEKVLVGQTTRSFQSIDSAIRVAMETSLRKILTPTSSLDLLREIDAVTATTSTAPQQQQQPRPYVISIVGVNGVGKSTSLAKLCYFLLQNRHRVLIAACDTFRSGAVEQLRVHARNLAELAAREAATAGAGADARAPAVELYERGYGRDAAAVARDAVAHGAARGFSVVLVDTAGRRHNDARLMAALGKFAALARPDKVFMVGEALVGADAVAQARHFGEAFGIGAGAGAGAGVGGGRGLDGFIVSKCDTVGDMVGALVSLVFATGVPVAFLGTGQHYGDLRTLNIAWAVRLLMA